MKKKFISILLSTVMLTATPPTVVFAKNYTTFKDVNGDEYYAEAAKALAELDILAGYEDGTFGADRDVTRAEMAAIICRMVGKEDEAVSERGYTDYDDVRSSHWASGYINVASEEGIISGDGDGRFRPEDEVKYEEALKMVVCAVGLGDDVEVDPKDWSKEYLEIADDNYITDNLIGWKGHASTRGDVAVMVYNGLRQSSVSNVDVGIIDGDTYYVNDELYCEEPDEENIENEDGVMFVNNELIIHADPDKADYDDIEDLIYDYDGEIVGEIAVTGTYQVRFSDEYSYDELQDIINDLKKEDFVLWCSTNSVFEMEEDAFYPNDEKWDGQWDTTPDGDNWGVEAIKAPFAWEQYQSMDYVNVGVIDSCFYDHDDLVYSKRYFNHLEEINSSHGTHVTGTIAAGFNNGIGISGVAPHVNLFCSSQSGLKNMSHLMKYEFAFTILIIKDRCQVINISQNTGRLKGFAASRGNDAAITYFNTNAEAIGKYLNFIINLGYKDFVLCISAGNNNTIQYIRDSNPENIYGYKEYDSEHDSRNAQKYHGDAEAIYNNFLNAITIPEVKDRIIVVGSCKNSGNSRYTYSAFSNVGNRVDVVAPGERIYSTVPNNDYQNNFDEFDRNGKFLRNRVWSGTSMATPHVSGLAAMLFSLDNSLDGAEVKKIITSTANIPVNGCNYKMINAENAVKELLTEVQFSIFDDNNQELSNVKAVVDNGMYRFSDKNGEVSLYLSDGDHKVQFSKDGYETEEIILHNLDYRDGMIYLDSIEMTPIEETETISIPAKHEPISSGDYVESFEYDYNKLLNGDFSDFAGVWKTVSQTNNIEKNLIGTWNYQGFASAWKIGTLTFNSDGSIENSGMRLWYKGTYKVVDEETIKLNFTDNSGYAPPSEDGGGSFQIEPFDIILKYNAEDNSITVPTDAYEYDGYEEGAIYKKENETYINDTQHSIYLRSDGIPEGDESCTVQDITKNPDGSYSWRIISNYGDGYTIILYPTNVNVTSWDGKIIQTDTSKPRLWMGNGSVTDTPYNFYYMQSDDNNKTNRQFSYYYNFKHAISFDNFCNYVPYYEKYEDTANAYTVRYDTTDWSDFDIGSYIETYIDAMSSEGYDVEQGEDSVAGEIKYFFRNDYDKSYNQVYLEYNYRFHYLTISIIVDSTKPVG